MKERGLNDRQRIVTLEYLKDLNATQAAIRAGYSARTASPAASRLLGNVKVQAEIQRAKSARKKRLEIDDDTVLRELAVLAFANIADYIAVQEDGSARIDLARSSREKLAAIKKLTFYSFTRATGDNQRLFRGFRLVLTDKLCSLELLGRHLGLFSMKSANESQDLVTALAEMTAILGLEKLTDEQLEQVEAELSLANGRQSSRLTHH